MAAPFHYSQMIWGITLGWLIFHDPVDIWTIAGAGIIISAGLWLIHQGSRDGAASA
jgi:S-adenosylmethionine uptake transporter